MKRDDRVFSDLWSNVITPQIDELCKKDRVSCPDYNDARERVWNSYCAFNWNYSNRYLEVRDGELDRHKAAACYMCAILDALPLLVDIEDPNEDREAYLSNERLAICVGVSVLGMFECANLEGLQSRLDGLINEGCSERDLERIPIAERIAAPGRTKKRRIVRVSNHDSRELTQFPILNSVDNYELNGRC